jgi:hypothetical protein
MPGAHATNPALDVLLAAGEMGELVRSLDWSATPLGAPKNWSPALHTVVRILLANRFPQILWRGGSTSRSITMPAAPFWGANTLGLSEDRCATVGRKSGTS